MLRLSAVYYCGSVYACAVHCRRKAARRHTAKHTVAANHYITFYTTTNLVFLLSDSSIVRQTLITITPATMIVHVSLHAKECGTCMACCNAWSMKHSLPVHAFVVTLVTS